MPKVTMIPATINPLTHLPSAAARKRRVAGYARVSTDSDEQFTSYEAQVDYYTRFIQSKPEWEFVKVYTDEGISGTNTKRREGFKEMIADALAGEIDLIVTKSVSRFARNTVDSLVTIRQLKENGVRGAFFKMRLVHKVPEKVHIYSLVFFGQTKYNILIIYRRCAMDYITTKQAAEKWQISDRRVLQFCNAGRIEGAEKMGNTWLIPKDAKKPIDGRYKKLDDREKKHDIKEQVSNM